MKTINILLTICLFIVTGLLITVLMSKDSVAEVGSNYEMHCEKVSMKGNGYRCVNYEIKCYYFKDTGAYCKFTR